MNRNIIFLIVIGIIFLGIVLLFKPKVGKVPEKVKIGFIGPLTGDVAYIGENIKFALEIARDKINQSGGINGREVELIFEDGKCDPTQAVNSANKLINIDKIFAIIGGVCSSETLAIAPLAEQNKVILISPASTNPDISKSGDYIFRVVPPDNFQAKFAAEYVINKLKIKKAAILSCLSDWCVGLKNSFKDNFIKLGGEIVSEEEFKQDETDLKTQLIKIKIKNPDLIYFVAYTQSTIAGLKQIKELGINSTIFGADAWSDPIIWQSVGQLGEGAIFTEPANKNLPEWFVQEMNKKTGGNEINIYAPRAYDALMILVEAMKNGNFNPEKVKNNLYQIKDFQGIADIYTFDENGDPIKAIYSVKKISNQKPTLIE